MDDREYFDEFQKLFNMKRERYFLVTGRKDFYRACADEYCLHSTTDNEGQRKDLERTIINFERGLDERVASALEDGQRFTIEDFASKFKLSTFQKKVVLTLIGMLLSTSAENADVAALIDFIDFNASPLDKLKRQKEFFRESSLIKNKILWKVVTPVHHLRRTDAVCLRSTIRSNLVALLTGGPCKWESPNGPKPDIPCRIGALDSPKYLMDQVVISKNDSMQIKKYLNGFIRMNRAGKSIKDKYLAFLFYGPPGTGKTMLGESIASYLGRKVMRVKLEEIISQWLGVAEQNLDELFSYCSRKKVVLLIDEVDSLVLERRISNHEASLRITNSLLGCLDRFSGIAVLTTNLSGKLDTALERRITVKMEFGMPDYELRKRIWESHIQRAGKDFKISEDIDYSMLASEFQFSGGEIKNAVKNGVLMAISKDKDIISLDEILSGAKDQDKARFTAGTKGRTVKGFAG